MSWPRALIPLRIANQRPHAKGLALPSDQALSSCWQLMRSLYGRTRKKPPWCTSSEDQIRWSGRYSAASGREEAHCVGLLSRCIRFADQQAQPGCAGRTAPAWQCVHLTQLASGNCQLPAPAHLSAARAPAACRSGRWERQRKHLGSGPLGWGRAGARWGLHHSGRASGQRQPWADWDEAGWEGAVQPVLHHQLSSSCNSACGPAGATPGLACHVQVAHGGVHRSVQQLTLLFVHLGLGTCASKSTMSVGLEPAAFVAALRVQASPVLMNNGRFSALPLPTCPRSNSEAMKVRCWRSTAMAAR